MMVGQERGNKIIHFWGCDKMKSSEKFMLKEYGYPLVLALTLAGLFHVLTGLVVSLSSDMTNI